MDLGFIITTILAIAGAMLIIAIISVGLPILLARSMKSYNAVTILAVSIYTVIFIVCCPLLMLAITLQFDGRIIMLFITAIASCIVSGWNLRPVWEQRHSEP